MARRTLLGYVQGLYGNEEDSDCYIRFYKPQDGAPEPRKWLSDAIPAHTLLLKAASERLRMQLKNPGWQQTRASDAAEDTDEQQQQKRRKLGTPDDAADAGIGTSDGNVDSTSAAVAPAERPQLLVALDGPHELQPALEVLQCMYTGSLSAAATATPYDTVLAYKLAQYLLAPDVKEACLARLREVKAGDAALQPSACRLFAAPEAAFALDEPELRPFVDACWAAVLALLPSPEPPAAQGVDSSLAELLELCWDAVVAQHDERPQWAAQALLARLGDTLRVARSEQLSAMLCRLPLGALQLLMQHDQLKVDCEDTVLLLLHRWAVHNAPLPDGAAPQLRTLLRPLQLSPSYRSHLLPKLTWLGLTADEAADLAFAASMLGQAVCQEMFKELALHATQPAWLLADSRTGAAGGGGKEIKLALVVQQNELEERIAALSAAASRGQTSTSTENWNGTREYWMGYEWWLGLQICCSSSQDNASDAAPGSNARTDGKAGLFVYCSLPTDFAALGVRTATSFLVKSSISAERANAPMSSQALAAWLMSTGQGWGSPQFLMSSGALDVASWRPWLVGGALHAMATLQRV